MPSNYKKNQENTMQHTDEKRKRKNEMFAYAAQLIPWLANAEEMGVSGSIA